ncbi:MAG: LLM class flavin-dependent oxidoreductase [Gammaproteobacteria bacterium]|nr:LLM class flavin-dependent oxidoreductase [Gammaproteobacteria bacterium]MYF30141.1 LLM class flavin-dependent oxidoreductase [Gammaproteobacteria bacterium]MYK44664.1 LLM class flavin-dependent oxidoreductase [Gammaproteobacteria bacterium]
MGTTPEFGLNRFDWTSTESFVADVRRAEELGFGYALIPRNPLSRPDPYMQLAVTAERTSRIRLGLLLDNPVLHHPATSASSIATLDEISAGRALLTYGIGDTAVRWLGLRPARVAELEKATVLAKRLLMGEEVEIGAVRPARLQHARPVPVWIAAGGPKTIEMAARVADGVFLRVGRHPDNLRAAMARIRRGAMAAGRNPVDIGIGLIFHTVASDDPAETRAIARSMAAGYYEYSPALFEIPGLRWNGPPVEALKRRVYPDFHHAPDLAASGKLVDFLDDETADSFSLFGTAQDIAGQLQRAIEITGRADIVVPHPVPMPKPGEPVARVLRSAPPGADYKTWFASEVMPLL